MLEHSPATISLPQLLPQLQSEGYAVLDPATVAQWAHHPLNALTALVPDWEGMPEDAYLKMAATTAYVVTLALFLKIVNSR